MIQNSTQVLVWGDIHGCAKSLESAMAISNDLSVKTIFLGDYVDRGPDSLDVLNILIDAQDKNQEWIFLMGNHERMLQDLIDNPDLIDQNGVLESGDNYSYLETSKTFREILNSNWLNLESVKRFLYSLRYYHVQGNYIFVHAPLSDNSSDIHIKSLQDLLWSYTYNPPWTRCKFIHGHDRVKDVLHQGYGLNINTSCGFGGYLSGVHIDLISNAIINIFKISEVGQII
jgi:serine/threonine protein phosphatase 1